jgi:hypothetical protein
MGGEGKDLKVERRKENEYSVKVCYKGPGSAELDEID